jgi:tryptophan synthase alpha chain
MNRIDKKFIELKNQGKKGFIAYITAGDPNLIVTEKLIPKLEKVGVDFLELGVPFSDPMADGAVIQRASERALKAKTNLHKILAMTKELRRKTDLPMILFTYMNPVFCYGWKKFSNDAKKCGIDGILVLDLPVEESTREKKMLADNGMKMIYLIAPTSSEDRIKLICKNASGFIYYVSRTGVTGAQDSVAHDVKQMVGKLRSFTKLPVAVGFGISKSEHVLSVSKYADAVVVGSAIVSKIEQNLKNKNLILKVGEFVKKLKGGI